ncbi:MULTISPECIES: DUF488 domain-containing protein [Spirulina sp. CCY15215]|uniref:DUF488 domain-containing protein n=1 Tax=Spirulina sp. CCY15215 TaxID=2767591 RepID=UPI001950B49E|nr:DUF488 domain-containing protein [Spirulina major]
MKNPLFTIGHSNLSLEVFLELLQKHEITALADVRSHPYSRYLPHFNKPSLQEALETVEIPYVFLGRELGARPTDLSCYIGGKAIHDRIAATPLFHAGIQRIIKGLESYRIALMCAEKDPLTCHRTILVCRKLQNYDIIINHILSDGQLESQESIENRLLVLHGFQTAKGQPQQLSLFDLMEAPPSRENCLLQAYQKQSDRIAFMEKQEK